MIDQFLAAIRAHQAGPDDPRFPEGLFPSQRFKRSIGYSRPDGNIFYSALIARLLLALRDRLPKQPTDAIIAGVRAVLPRYASTGYPYEFNFYQTHPHAPFPNGYLLHRLARFRLADDADSTSVIQQLYSGGNPARERHLRQRLAAAANGSRKWTRSPLTAYPELRAYGVWLGTGRLAVELDLAVMTNVLGYVFARGLALTVHDTDSLEFIRRAIVSRQILRDPFSLTFSYPRPAVLLYHVCRLVSQLPEPEKYLPLDELRLVVQDGAAHAPAYMDRLLLATCRLWLGMTTDFRCGSVEEVLREGREYAFFLGTMTAGTDYYLLNRLIKYRPVQMDWTCDAHHLALALECTALQSARCIYL